MPRRAQGVLETIDIGRDAPCFQERELLLRERELPAEFGILEPQPSFEARHQLRGCDRKSRRGCVVGRPRANLAVEGAPVRCRRLEPQGSVQTVDANTNRVRRRPEPQRDRVARLEVQLLRSRVGDPDASGRASGDLSDVCERVGASEQTDIEPGSGVLSVRRRHRGCHDREDSGFDMRNARYRSTDQGVSVQHGQSWLVEAPR
jgi:hypothetical protein